MLLYTNCITYLNKSKTVLQSLKEKYDVTASFFRDRKHRFIEKDEGIAVTLINLVP